MIEKATVFILFIFLTVSARAQVTGVILDNKGNAISYASVVVKGVDIGIATDSLGMFSIEANVGDTLLIYHLNIGCQSRLIRAIDNIFRFNRENHMLSEIQVSNKFAFNLFDSCRINTYKKLRNDYYLRGYWRGIEICNSDTLRKVDMDFDVCQKNINKIGRGGSINLRKIQERTVIVSDNRKPYKPINFQVRVKPLENNFLIYRNFEKEYNYKIRENDEYLNLIFMPKNTVNKGYNNIDISIRKRDMCINYIASCTAKSKRIYALSKSISANRKIKAKEIALFLKYEYTRDYCYLSYSEMSEVFQVSRRDGSKSNMEHISKYKVYDSAVDLSELREGKTVTRFNILDKASNDYSEEFWKKPAFIFSAQYNYNFLRLVDRKDEKHMVSHY